MSTRSVLYVIGRGYDGTEAAQLYRHYDGYPHSKHGVVHAVKEAHKLLACAKETSSWGKTVMTFGTQGYSRKFRESHTGKRYLSANQSYELESWGIVHGDTEYEYILFVHPAGWYLRVFSMRDCEFNLDPIAVQEHFIGMHSRSIKVQDAVRISASVAAYDAFQYRVQPFIGGGGGVVDTWRPVDSLKAGFRLR